MVRTIAVLVYILAATAAAQAEPCKTEGDAAATELTFNLRNTHAIRGLNIAFRFGLEPAEFPQQDIAAIAAPCSRGTFVAGNSMLELFGENEGTPPRWARTSRAGGPVVFAALMPRPDPARAWVDSGQKAGADGSVAFKPEEMMYAIVLQAEPESKLRLVFAFFDKLPDDERLKSIMQTILAGKARWQVGFDVATRAVTPNPSER